MDEQKGSFWLRVSVYMWCVEMFLFGVIGRGTSSSAVTLAAASPTHSLSVHLNLSSSPETILFQDPVVCLTLTVNKVCSAVLLTESSSWPDWCLGSKACSHMSVVQLTHPLFCTSSNWQDPPSLFSFAPPQLLLFVYRHRPDICFFVVYILSLPITCLFPAVQVTIARWHVDAKKTYFHRITKTKTPLSCWNTEENNSETIRSKYLSELIVPCYSRRALRNTNHICIDQMSDQACDRILCNVTDT